VDCHSVSAGRKFIPLQRARRRLRFQRKKAIGNLPQSRPVWTKQQTQTNFFSLQRTSIVKPWNRRSQLNFAKEPCLKHTVFPAYRCVDAIDIQTGAFHEYPDARTRKKI
jgi:hypothetical protein